MKKLNDSERLTVVLLGASVALVVVVLAVMQIWPSAVAIMGVVLLAWATIPWMLTLVVAGYTKPGVTLKQRSVLLGQLSTLGNWLGGAALLLVSAIIGADIEKASDSQQLSFDLLSFLVAATALGAMIASVGAWIGLRLASVEDRNSAREKLIVATKRWGHDRIVLIVANAICTTWVTSLWALFSCLFSPYLIFLFGVAVAARFHQ